MHSAYQQTGYVVHYGPVSWVCLPYSIPRNIRKENSCSCIYVRSQHSSMYYKPRGKKMLAYRLHYHKPFLGQKPFLYQTSCFKNQASIYPVLECD